MPPMLGPVTSRRAWDSEGLIFVSLGMKHLEPVMVTHGCTIWLTSRKLNGLF